MNQRGEKRKGGSSGYNRGDGRAKSYAGLDSRKKQNKERRKEDTPQKEKEKKKDDFKGRHDTGKKIRPK